MTKGIRAFVNETFNSTLPRLGELGNIAFRAEVMNQAIMAFGINVASAATHYNHSLKMAKAANPEAVAGLGRSEDKKGGRKPTLVDVVKAKSGEVVATGVTKAAAEAMIAKAIAAKKTKLSIKVVINMPAEVPATPAEAALESGALHAEAALV